MSKKAGVYVCKLKVFPSRNFLRIFRVVCKGLERGFCCTFRGKAMFASVHSKHCKVLSISNIHRVF